MIKSMTGYGRSLCQFKQKSIQVEIRSLNSKNLDVFFRIPQAYKLKEPDFRNLVSKTLERGKIDVDVVVNCPKEPTGYTLNKKLFKKYYRMLKDLSDELRAEETQDLLSSILKLPDVLSPLEEEVEQDEWKELERCFKEALENTDKYRQSEGQHMSANLKTRIEQIALLLEQIEPYEKGRIEKIKLKLQNSLLEINTEYDNNRFEQELIYYLEKIDINEEKVRLIKHIEHFNETLANNSSNNGKKLGFISQELGREINTIGSKAYDANIQKIVVQMKDELEKIKEMLLNIL